MSLSRLLQRIARLFEKPASRRIRSARLMSLAAGGCEQLEHRQLLTVYSIDPIHGLDTNPGTLEAPFQTPRNLSYSASAETDHYVALQPGDTVYLRDGVHDWSSLLAEIPNKPDSAGAAFLLVGVHGTETQPVSVAAYPGEHPIVTGRESGQEN
ncbi:MAG: hypothetical protein KDA85_04295, partial [Planctomycetaceae bacterium]|nr:hypothetical protein [Planctomycetaceae bacterium]